MSAPAFTPGPWATRPDRPTQVMGCADESFIADCEGLEPGGCPSDEANARLIAAAPELYEALASVEREGRDANADGDVLIPSCVWDSVRAALAKAVAP